LWREAYFEVKMYKTHHGRSTFRSWDDENVHAVVARSIFRSQNGRNTAGSEPFWQWRCPKSVKRSTFRSQYDKHLRFGALLKVEMFKKRAVLRHEAQVEAKMLKRSKSTKCSGHFWTRWP
jgi:hypothetical protein